MMAWPRRDPSANINSDIQIMLDADPKSAIYRSGPVPIRGAFRDRHKRGMGCGGRGCAFDEQRKRVRRSRVVLAPRCWRQALGRQRLGGDGDNKPAHRGGHDISRKAIAQGMSECLRSPVCSCAAFLRSFARETAGERAPGIPCALCFQGQRISCTSPGSASRECFRSSFRGRAQREPESTTTGRRCFKEAVDHSRNNNVRSMDSGPALSGASRNEARETRRGIAKPCLQPLNARPHRNSAASCSTDMT